MQLDHNFYLDKLKRAVDVATAETKWDVNDIPNALDSFAVEADTLLMAAKVQSACERVVSEARRPTATVASVALQKVQALAAIDQLRAYLDRSPRRYEESA